MTIDELIEALQRAKEQSGYGYMEVKIDCKKGNSFTPVRVKLRLDWNPRVIQLCEE